MKKIIIFSILLLSAIAVTVGTTITTTIQIQPAYSQAQHCITRFLGETTCVTPGKDPLLTENGIPTPNQPTQQEAGKIIGREHVACAHVTLTTCTVIPP